MAEIYHHDLPPGYRSLRALPTETFPIVVRKKDKLDWRCITCGGVRPNLSLDNMEAAPEPSGGTGCRYCRSAKGMQCTLEAATHPRILSWYVDPNHPQLGNKGRDKEALRFQVECPHGHILDLHCSMVRHWRNKAENLCPTCRERAGYAQYMDQVADIRTHWPSAVIEFIHRGKPTNRTGTAKGPHYRVDIPGAAAPIGPTSTGRLRGPFTEQNVTQRRLRQVYKKDLADRERMERFINLGEDYGSAVYAFVFSGESASQRGELMARYRTVAGNITPAYRLTRAHDNKAGRTGLKLTQTLLQVTVYKMFPADTEWVVDDRTQLARFSGDPSCTFELDIGTHELVDGGLWIEYQGDPSHRNDPHVIHRDQLKAQWCASQALLLQIPNLANPNPQDCIEAIHDALARHPDTDRVAQARAHLTDPSIDRIWDSYMTAIKGHAVQLGIQLEQAIGVHGHQMLTPYQQIIRAGTYTMRCGYCRNTRRRNVHADLHNPPYGCCDDCSNTRHRAYYRDRRREYFKQYAWWPALPDKTKEQLAKGDDTVPCPRCGETISLTTIKRRTSMFCTVCDDTGVRHARSSAQAAAHRQHADRIEQTVRELIADFDCAPCDDWRRQVSWCDGVRYLTLTTENGPTTRTIGEWKQEHGKTMSKHRHAPETRYGQLAQAYPNLEIVEEDETHVVYWCGCATQAPDGGRIAHPVKRMRKRTLSDRYYKRGGAIAGAACYLHGLTAEQITSVTKSLGDLKARWRLRAAIVGDHHIPRTWQQTPTAIVKGDPNVDDLTAVSTSQCHVFYCADGRHRPTTCTPDNMFNKHKKGYCPECLDAAGQQGRNLDAEENERPIVAADKKSRG